jgi:hypothetical protein
MTNNFSTAKIEAGRMEVNINRPAWAITEGLRASGDRSRRRRKLNFAR